MNRKQCTALIVVAGALTALAGVMWYWYGYGGRAASQAASDDPTVRLGAAQTLRGRSSGLAQETLRSLSGDPEPKVAIEAVRSLSADADANHDVLRRILQESPDGRIRGEAAAALGNSARTEPSLLTSALADDPDPLARAGAARGLARLREPAALSALVDALEDESAAVRIRAITAIGKIIGLRFEYDAKAPAAQRAAQARTVRRLLRQRGLI